MNHARDNFEYPPMVKELLYHVYKSKVYHANITQELLLVGRALICLANNVVMNGKPLKKRKGKGRLKMAREQN